MRGLRIKNLVRQDYGFVIQFCQVTELLSVEKERSSVALVNTNIPINRHHPLVTSNLHEALLTYHQSLDSGCTIKSRNYESLLRSPIGQSILIFTQDPRDKSKTQRSQAISRWSQSSGVI